MLSNLIGHAICKIKRSLFLSLTSIECLNEKKKHNSNEFTLNSVNLVLYCHDILHTHIYLKSLLAKAVGLHNDK